MCTWWMLTLIQGHFFDPQRQSCRSCPLNSYQDREGRSECTPCDYPAFTSSTGAQACISVCVDVRRVVDGQRSLPHTRLDSFLRPSCASV